MSYCAKYKIVCFVFVFKLETKLETLKAVTTKIYHVINKPVYYPDYAISRFHYMFNTSSGNSKAVSDMGILFAMHG